MESQFFTWDALSALAGAYLLKGLFGDYKLGGESVQKRDHRRGRTFSEYGYAGTAEWS
ncbi:MAG: hypothetical protein K0Q87_4542 [Neobacillus sp.]|jgi:hypothetical protein|nr:hypothetical protein [Neobacillus sp.]